MIILSTIKRQSIRFYSTKIPFDTKPFPFSRFEPCCPATSHKADNGFVPCKQHPIPPVLGKKIDMTEPMTAASSLRHIVGCVGDGLEWTRSKVESVPGGIVQILMNAENDWLRHNRPLHTENALLTTVTDRPMEDHSLPDVLLFPEFKMIPHVETRHGVLPTDSTLYRVMDSIWRDPSQPLDTIQDWQDIQADTVVFVCTHGRRDLRCGRIGPLIIDEFNRIIQQKGLQDKVQVWGTSHFGGHKFAGNLIIHQRGLGGHMYGNVRQCHVESIFDRHIMQGKVIKEIWRKQVTPPSLSRGI
ncbi:Sucrase/ferredoxin-like-domain-containing protein [Gilbertella persicaria]|uniref:Altered inheritance of mitochondria protein 32 n=1 Tax=Rhizopus stolonifer TaxID=4846 RepID=A0A367KM25_RHIST|nr:Sucrase/ferredoxin-like-domain-containing protein [Gilbertella persicaria]KAI8084355.1 Sucrase/ferredoxin-like-domain-containing protein [Gilbertella persicaria]RCI03273.1 hypothetical protein CU098_008246 [Rhizopus stolonifer]